jgi:protein-S-isoprenylcysteine O-methyltransferase Ste14
MLEQHIIVIVLWILFAFFHSIFAWTKFKVQMQKLMKNNYPYYRIIYSVFALATLAFVLIYNFNLQSIMLWNVSLAENIFSITGIIVSVFIMMMFAKKFFFQLSGADIFLETEKPQKLIENSFYKHVRHPLYTATLLLIWSIFFLQPQLNNLISCLSITVYTLIGIGFEEKKLAKEFGDAYIQYRNKTPMLIPKLF